jgi:hypothetical protein
MMRILGPLHAFAAERGDGLLPEFARLWDASKAAAGAIKGADTAILYGERKMAQPTLGPMVTREIAFGGKVVPLRASKNPRPCKTVKSART